MPPKTLLVVGGTGHVGHQVIAALLARGAAVRALVRPGSDASKIDGPGVSIARGDMMDPPSLDAAFAGVDAVISCAAGYTRRRKSDTAQIDRVGNQNLAQAAKKAGVGRFVLNSILQCDDAPEVPHFADKAAAEAALRTLGVPFVAIRPGAFLDQSFDFVARNARKNSYVGVGDRDVTRWTYTYTPDLAEALVQAAFADERIVGQSIDLGWSTGPVTNEELADAIAAVTHRKLKRTIVPWWLFGLGTRVVGAFSESARDLGKMFSYLRKGRYVANCARQEVLLGPAPTMDSVLRRWAQERGLIQRETSSSHLGRRLAH